MEWVAVIGDITSNVFSAGESDYLAMIERENC